MNSVTKLAGQAMYGIGLAAAATAAIGIKNIDEYTKAIERLAVQSGKTMPAIDRQFGSLALSASNRTGMSLTDVLGIASQAAGVVKDPKELHAALVGTGRSGGLLDLVNVLQRSTDKPGDPNEIARNVITADHILNAYKQGDMARVNERLYRSVVGSHMELGPLVTQLGYFGEQYRLASGGRPAATEDILSLAELGYWGVGHGKWGAGFGQILRTVLKPSDKNVPALAALGMLNPDGTISSSTQNAAGQFTPMSMISEAIARTKGMRPMDVQRLVMQALPANAARVMAEALSPKTQGFLQRIDASQAGMPSILSAQHTLMNNLGDQSERLYKNFSNLSGILEKPVFLKLTDAASKAADALYGLINVAQQHPAASAAVGWGLLGAGSIAAWKFISGARVAVYGFMKNAGAAVIEDGKTFERSMVKALTSGIINIGKKGVDLVTGKFVLPLLAQVNKLGVVGENIASTVLGIVGKFGILGDALTTLLGVVGKIGGGALSAVLSVLTYQTPAGDEGDPLSAKRLNDFKKRNQAFHVLQAKKPPVVHAPPPSHRHKMRDVVQQVSVVVNASYTAPPHASSAEGKRLAMQRARHVANETAKAIAAAGRTITRTAGSTIGSATMSNWETEGGYA